MPNKKPAPPLDLAVGTLRRALSPTTTVEAEAGKRAGPPGSRWVVLNTAGSRTRHRVRLVPWPVANDAAAARDRILVLPPGPKSLVEKLRRDGANFIDPHRGLVRIHLPGLIVDRTDVSVPRRTSSDRRLANPFGDRASLVARVLASEPAGVWGTRELADVAGVSTMTASHTVRQLERLSVVRVEPAGRANRIHLESVESLVTIWSRYYAWDSNEIRTYAAPMGDTRRFLKRLRAALTTDRWALTLHAAAAAIAPIAVSNKVHLYLDIGDFGELDALAERAGWTEARDGRLVVAKPYYKQSVWYGLRTVGGLPVVSDVQLVLDLWDYPDRGREQALHLLQTRAHSA